jgi:two-component system, LuxR family, response regulator FixJ
MQTLILVDENIKRRAHLSHSLSMHQVHVEPFENVRELSKSWPNTGTIFIHETGSSVSELVDEMGQQNIFYPIIAFTEQPEVTQIVSAILHGAVDYLAWPTSNEGLLSAMARANSRNSRIGNARLRETVAKGRIGKLTEREREVLDCVASGLSNRKIGEKLEISPRTVEIHRSNMLSKLGATHTSQAIRIAIEAELIG